MKTQHFYIDLTQRPPRSFRVRLGNYDRAGRLRCSYQFYPGPGRVGRGIAGPNGLQAAGRTIPGIQTVCGSLLRRVQPVYDLAEKSRVSLRFN